MSMIDQRVLIVEDNEALRQTLRWTLEDEGFSAFDAGSISQAVEEATKAFPSLLVLDYGLPDGDGLGVVVALQERVAAVLPPIIVVTADGRAAEKASRVGAVVYLHKPFDLDQLVAMIRRALDK